MQIIINAGGTGTRLWPLSTQETPKQFVSLIDDESFITKTVNRLTQAQSNENIWVNTNIKYTGIVEDHVGDIVSSDRILTEPEKRDNFAAIICHSAVVAHSVGVDESLVFVHADHWVQEQDIVEWNNGLQAVGDAVASGQFDLVTAGVKPAHASTQFGYIEVAEEDKDVFDSAVNVIQFKEKPQQDLADSFIAAGNFVWNLGYFGFTYAALLEMLREFWPEIAKITEQIRESGVITAELYSQIPKIAFDIAVAEKTNSLGVIIMPIAWDDIGNWSAVRKYISDGENSLFYEAVGQGNTVLNYGRDKKIALIGVSDLIVVETNDSLLIVHPDAIGAVKGAAQHYDK